MRRTPEEQVSARHLIVGVFVVGGVVFVVFAVICLGTRPWLCQFAPAAFANASGFRKAVL
jgi:hypothetical protein